MRKYTVHDPDTVGRDVGLRDDKIEVSQDLHHLQQYPMLVDPIDLRRIIIIIIIIRRKRKKGEEKWGCWSMVLTLTSVVSAHVSLSTETLHTDETHHWKLETCKKRERERETLRGSFFR